MKKLLIIVLSALVLIGGGIYFLLPTNINWQEYTQGIEKEVKARTGLAFKIQGTPVFSMQSAKVSLGKVSLGNLKDATYPQMMVAQSAEIIFDKAALFRRQIKIKKIVLTSPEFYFESLPNGSWNWQTAFFDRASKQGSGIGFESLLFTNGVAFIKQDKYSPEKKWEKINTELFADSIHGPFFLEGNFGARSTSFGFSLKVENFQPRQTPDFTLRLINTPAEASFVLSGRYGLTEKDAGTLKGGLTFDIRKPNKFFDILYPQEKLPKAVFQPIVGNLKLNQNSKTKITQLSDILFKYGESAATGKLDIRSLSSAEVLESQSEEASDALEEELEDEIVLRDPNNPTVEVKLDDKPLKKRELNAALLPKEVKGSFVFSKLAADTFVENRGVLLDFFEKTASFSQTQDSYDLNFVFDTVQYKNNPIYQLKMHVLSIQDGLALNDISAVLPANGYLDAQGTLMLQKNSEFFGKGTLETEKIRVLLEWLGVKIPEEIPQTLLQGFKASADFKFSKEFVSFSNVKSELDRNEILGELIVRKGKRNLVKIEAVTPELDFSAYFPAKNEEFLAKRKSFSDLSSLKKVETLFSSLDFLNQIDVDVKLEAEKFSFANIFAQNLVADLTILQGSMEIQEFSVDKVLGSSFNLAGNLEGFGREPKFLNFKMQINSQQLSSLLDELKITLPKGIFSQDKMIFSATLTGNLPALTVDLLADFDLSEFNLKGNVKGLSEKGYSDLDLDIKISHENFRNFIALFTNKYRPILSNPGALDLQAHLLKNARHITLSEVVGKIGENDFTGKLKISKGDERPLLQAQIHSQSLAPLAFLPKMNFVEAMSVLPQEEKTITIWEKEGFLTTFFNKLDFSKNKLDFSFLGNVDAEIEIKADKFSLNSFVLKDFNGILRLVSNKIFLDIKRSVWDNANLGAMSTITLDGDKTLLKTGFRLSKLNIPVSLFDFKSLGLKNLKNATFTFNFTSEGKTTKELVEALQGQGNFTFDEGELLGFDYFKTETKINDLLNSTQTPFFEETSLEITSLKTFSSDFDVKKEVISFYPVSFSLEENVNQKSFFKYSLGNKALNARVDFDSLALPNQKYSIAVIKKPNEEATFSTNVQEIVDSLLKSKKQEQEEDLLRRQEEQKQALLKKKEQEKALQEQKAEDLQKQKQIQQENKEKYVSILSELEQSLLFTLTDLSQKIETVQGYVEEFPLVEKYVTQLKEISSVLEKLNNSVSLEKNKEEPLLIVVENLKQEVTLSLIENTQKISQAYTAAVLLGEKGLIFNILKQSNEILAEESKNKTLHADLTEIPGRLEVIIKDVDKIKQIRQESEVQGKEYEDLLLLRGEAEALFQEIQILSKKNKTLIDEKINKIKAEEEAKRLAEEKKKQEEEAKKKAEKERKEAEEKARQSTIFRKDSQGALRKTSSSSEGFLTLKPVEEESALTFETTQEKSDEVVKPMIIRKK